MSSTCRSPWGPALLAACFLTAAAAGQEVLRPEAIVRPATRKELDRVEALKLYGRSVLHERANELIQALRCLEEARRLDPDAAAIHRALAPLYLAVDRADEALAACRRALECDPDDFETGHLYARHLQSLRRTREAADVLTKLVERPRLKDDLPMQARLCHDLGLLDEELGNWEKAETAYRRVLDVLEHPEALREHSDIPEDELRGRAADVAERLGRVCLKAGKPDAAVAAYALAGKKDPERAPRLQFHVAQVLQARGQLREALASLDGYLRTLPAGPEPYEMKITLLRKLNRADDILPELEAAAARDAHNSALQLLLAREYGKAGQTAVAERLYDRLNKERPTPEIARGLLEVYKAGPRPGDKILNRLDALLRDSQEKKDKQPGDPAAAAQARALLAALRDDPEAVRQLLGAARPRLLGGGKLNDLTYGLLGQLAARARQLDVAEELYRACLAAGARDDTEHDAYAGLLRVLALAHKNREIIEVCKQGLTRARATNRVLFHFDLSHALMALGRTREALAAADDAVNESNDRSRLMCRRNRAHLLSQAGKHAEAIAECQALLKEYNQAGEVRDIRYTLSGVYSAAREHAQAEEELRKILEADPADATACNDLGYLLADRNVKLEEAEALVRKALDLDRKARAGGAGNDPDADLDNAAYVDSLGWVLFRRGKLAEAREQLEKAAGMFGGRDDPVVWDHLGDVYFRLEQPQKARAAWQKAVSLFEAGVRHTPEEQVNEVRAKLRQLTTP
jgi:tetratricopeptide (TPR) repeat protein